MVFENVKVVHKAFGAGVITERVGNYITVKFESATKKFVYPDVFEKFLTLSDGTVPDEIKSDLCEALRVKQLIRDKKNEENLRAMTHGIVIPGKEAGSDSEDDDMRHKDSDEV